MNRTIQIIVSVVVLVIVAGGSFYGGMLYGQSESRSGRTAGARFAGGANGGTPGFGVQGGTGGQGRQGGVFGQITEVGASYIVITDNNGKQTKVMVTDTTLIEKNASVKLTDLATGDTVIISGSAGSDGTYTARSVQVAPAGRFGGTGGNGPNGGGPANGTNP